MLGLSRKDPSAKAFLLLVGRFLLARARRRQSEARRRRQGLIYAKIGDAPELGLDLPGMRYPEIMLHRRRVTELLKPTPKSI